MYLEYHSVCPLVRIGTLYRKRVCSVTPPPPNKGGWHTHLRVRRWEVPIRMTGEKPDILSVYSVDCPPPTPYFNSFVKRATYEWHPLFKKQVPVPYWLLIRFIIENPGAHEWHYSFKKQVPVPYWLLIRFIIVILRFRCRFFKANSEQQRSRKGVVRQKQFESQHEPDLFKKERLEKPCENNYRIWVKSMCWKLKLFHRFQHLMWVYAHKLNFYP